MDEVLTLKEAAAFLKLHKQTVRKLAKAKRIPCRKLGGDWRFMRSALEKYLGAVPAEPRKVA